MNVINTEKAPGAIGPYSQAFEVNGCIYTSGQIPVNPADGSVPEGIAAQAEQSCKNVGAIVCKILYFQAGEKLCGCEDPSQGCTVRD